MTVTNGLVRRRQRTAAFRESPEDEQMELQDTVRLRERPTKRNRDRGDMLNRNKRRRGSFNKDDGKESTEESVENDEEDYEVDDAGLTNRMLSPTTAGSPSSPLNYSGHGRNYLPMRVANQAMSLKVFDEMIGVAVPRKARSASAKRSYDNGSSAGGGGVVGEDKSYRQRSNSPAKLSVEVALPSSSNFSVGKKMKPGPKTRLPKVSKTSGSAQDDIEIEIAEVLYGLMKQSQSSKHQDCKNQSKHDDEDTDGTSNHFKTWVSPRVAVPTHSQSSFCPKHRDHASDLVLGAKEKKSMMAFPVAKEKRMKAADSSTTIENSSSAEPIKMESDQPAKMEVSSPKLENKSRSNAYLSDAGVPEVASGSMEMQEKIVKQEDSKPLMEEPSDLDGVEKPISLKAQSSSSPELDFDIQDSVATKGTSTAFVVDSQREEKLKIDLTAAAPAPVSSSSSLEREGVSALISKPLINDVDMPETMTKDEERVERSVKKEAAIYRQKKVETTMEKQEMQKLDSEKPFQDNESKLNQQGHKTQPRATVSKMEKTACSSSVPLPIAVAGWSSGLPPLGYMPPFQTVVPMGSSTTLQSPKPLLSQPIRKRCATHHHIACNIYLHQQLTKMNQFCPAGAGSTPLCRTKPNNLDVMPPAENLVMGSSLLGNFPGRKLSHSHEKGQDVGNFPGHSGKDKSSGPANLMETSQRKQIVLPQAPQPASANNLMHAPAFIFPLSQHQSPITATPHHSRSSKSAKSANNASVSSNSAVGAMGVSSALPSVATAVSFNYQNLASKEVPYLALLQNNGYPFPISTPIGTTPAIGGGTHAQAMPFFNGPFYSSQMLNPSQLQQQQPHPQIPVLPTHQNTSTSSGSALSHKKSESRQLQGTQVSGNNFFTSANMQLQQPQKHYVPVSHQSRKLEAEVSVENSPSTADTYASQAQKSASCQNFAFQFQPLNYTLMPSATMVGQGGGNWGEKSQQQGLKGGVELIPQEFAMSLTSFTGNVTASSLNFSSMPQNPAIFQSLPDMIRQGFQAPAPQAMHHKNNKVPEGKTGGASSNSDDGIKAATGKYSSTMGQTLAFDNSVRTLNFMSSPVTGNWTSRPISSTSISTSIPATGNIPSSSQQQHLFQLQLQNQHMLLQQQKHAVAARSKTPSTNSLPSSSVAGKFANNGPVSSQALIQCNVSVQSGQSKNSGRTIASQVPNSSLISSNTSTLKNVSQQGRASPGHTQISFGGNSGPAPEGQQTPNNKSSFSFGSGSPSKDGSLRTNTTGGKACSSTSAPQPQQTENSTIGNGQKSSPVCGRNVPSILSACPELKY
ncbi:hypothetical protein FNV43_RR23384 [Rhamnella rubrinervis]|uniref:Protein TIME FOR COFFEE n=1 Tax=Rhamnella rubrinervis TaxID=2594499 RepID=A0A8K0DRW8_9ROSA|nr:hypothetical protein FNV43_RR23384 [Rhamnella rubrinervis]